MSGTSILGSSPNASQHAVRWSDGESLLQLPSQDDVLLFSTCRPHLLKRQLPPLVAAASASAAAWRAAWWPA
jgi:hypothetical protein